MTSMIERALQLVDANPLDLVVAANVRGEARLAPEFVDSIRERGVLEPIVAYRDADENLNVLYGKRRTLAAREAGRDLVPVVLVLEPDDADRLVDQLVENEHRAPLTNAERAAAYQQLAAIGLSEFEMAKRTAAPVEEVAAAIEVAGSRAATAAVAQQPTLTLQQAAGIAEFDHDPEAVAELVEAARNRPDRLDHQLQRLRDDRDQAQRYEEEKAELEAAGETVVPAPPKFDSKGRSKTITELATDGGKALTAAKHRKCPGRALFLGETWDGGRRVGWTPYEACTDYVKHGHQLLWGSSTSALPAAELSAEEREQATAARREVVENNKAWAAAEPVRQAWLKTFIGRKTAPKGTAVFLLAALTADSTVADARVQGSNSHARELLGLPARAYGEPDKLAELATSQLVDARALMLALTVVLAAYEGATDREAWRTARPGTARYLRFLEANGYALSTIEQTACEKAEG